VHADEDLVIYFAIWFYGWLIISNIILFCLGYHLHDLHVYLPIWGYSALICSLIYPITPKIINLFFKNKGFKLNILFEVQEWHWIWFIFCAPILHVITSLSILHYLSTLDGNNKLIYIDAFTYDLDRTYILYGALYPLIWSISAIIWFFIIPIASIIIHYSMSNEVRFKPKTKSHFFSKEILDPRNKKHAPTYFKDKFICPICKLYVKHSWIQNVFERIQSNNSIKFSISKCSNCLNLMIWSADHKEIIFPKINQVEEPNVELNKDIKEIYIEAATILDESSRASAALLRLCLEKLLIQISIPGRTLNDMISNLIEKGVDENIRKACDLVRIHGNEAIHPGEINIKDNRYIATNLFWLINKIASIEITEKKKIQLLYDRTISDGKKKSIEIRDLKKKGKKQK